MGGRYTVSLALAHAVLITLGYAAATNSALIAQIGSFLTSYPDLLEATAALALFVALAATSARAARRRLPYEAWHLMHLSAYLAVYLGFGHQIANGAQFVADPVARWAWTALYVGAGLAALWYRFATPLCGPGTTCGWRGSSGEGPDAVSVLVSGRNLDRLGAQSGQFPLALPHRPAGVVGQPVLFGARPRACCGSPPRTSAATAARWRPSGRAPGSSPRGRTAR